MTNAVAEKNGNVESLDEIQEKVLWPEKVSIKNLIPDRIRVREVSEKDQDVIELAESIKRHGVMSPIIIRSPEKNRVTINEDSQWFIVAGNRRVAAAKLAGLKKIPAITVSLSDDAARGVAMAENIQRKAMNAVDEAIAIKGMMDNLIAVDNGQDFLTVVAAMLGKPRSYVYSARMLLDLPLKLLDGLREGTVPVRMCHLIARVDKKYHDRLAKFVTSKMGYNNRLPTIPELQKEIERTVEKSLSEAWFPKDKPFAGEVACVACPMNSKNTNELFGDLGLEQGKCGGPACFAKKQKAVVSQLEARVRAHFPKLEFRGIGTETAWSSSSVIKGWPVVGAVAYAKKEAEKYSDAKRFAIGVLKPRSGSGSQKRPAAVLLQHPGAKKKEGEGSHRDWNREHQVNEAMSKAITGYLMEKVEKITDSQWRDMLNHFGWSTRSVLTKFAKLEKEIPALDARKLVLRMSGQHLLMTVFWSFAFNNRVPVGDLSKWFNVDIKDVGAKAKKEAEAAYDAKKEKK